MSRTPPTQYGPGDYQTWGGNELSGISGDPREPDAMSEDQICERICEAGTEQNDQAVEFFIEHIGTDWLVTRLLEAFVSCTGEADFKARLSGKIGTTLYEQAQATVDEVLSYRVEQEDERWKLKCPA